MHRGYIKLWRKISDNPLWTDSKFTPGQAWIDLILLANHKVGHIRVRGIKVEVPRGYCGWSQVALSDRWKWSRGKVIRFLDELEMIQQIEQQKNNVTTLIKILNYDEYQCNGTADNTADGQQTDSKQYTNKNDKNEKNDNIIAGTLIPATNNCPYEKIKDLYHTILPTLPRVRILTPKRQSSIKARWTQKFTLKDGTPSNTIEFWEKYFTYISESQFLMGQVEPLKGRKRFIADLEWVTNASNFAKIIEGKYH